MPEISGDILKLMELAGEKGSRPLDRLERGKPLAKGREAVSQSSLAPLVQSALFLYFDCFDEAHQLAQDHEGATGNWLHAIAHRREPDAGNSKYWYARVKIPPKAGQGIAREALEALGTQPPRELEALRRKLAESGEWEPGAFVDLCDRFRKEDRREPAYRALAQIQEIEWRGLIGQIPPA